MKNKIIVGVDISDLKVAATGQKTFLYELSTSSDQVMPASSRHEEHLGSPRRLAACPQQW